MIGEFNGVKHVAKNVNLFAEETIIWNGTDTEKVTSDIGVPNRDKIIVRIDNQSGEDLDVQFQFKLDEEYLDYLGADGELLGFTIHNNEHNVYGPIQGFPRYDGGRIVLTAASAPTDGNETTVQVQEV